MHRQIHQTILSLHASAIPLRALKPVRFRLRLAAACCALCIGLPSWAADDRAGLRLPLAEVHASVETIQGSVAALPVPVAVAPAADAHEPAGVDALFGSEAGKRHIGQLPVDALRYVTTTAVSSVNTVATAATSAATTVASTVVERANTVATRATSVATSVASAATHKVLDLAGVIQQGVASWYGAELHNRRTASGERFNMNALTAAHPTLPFGTLLCAHVPATGKSVIVRVNDRGPFIKDRIIDFSRAAARALGILESKPGVVALLDSSDQRCAAG